ncbi:hypothetical protein HPULCUR_006554 [Helicostylum pulchrum]|uniref:Uncharacterized protein n=1 Tax=Helicostylum pulchrum TaxID=562976 RepID=A0ABP9Y482_9FUNG
MTHLASDATSLTNHISSINQRNQTPSLFKPVNIPLVCYSGKPAESPPPAAAEDFSLVATDVCPLASSIGPEDMFLSSLNFGLQNQQQQQLQQQQLQQQLEQQKLECHQLEQQHRQHQHQQIEQRQQLKQHIEQQQQQQQQQCKQNIENTVETNFNPYARIDLIDEYGPLQQHFDVASLSSKLPIWEVPSGVTWNEWETFLKANVSNDNEIYQSNNL